MKKSSLVVMLVLSVCLQVAMIGMESRAAETDDVVKKEVSFTITHKAASEDAAMDYARTTIKFFKDACKAKYQIELDDGKWNSKIEVTYNSIDNHKYLYLHRTIVAFMYKQDVEINMKVRDPESGFVILTPGSTVLEWHDVLTPGDKVKIVSSMGLDCSRIGIMAGMVATLEAYDARDNTWMATFPNGDSHWIGDSYSLNCRTEFVKIN